MLQVIELLSEKLDDENILFSFEHLFEFYVNILNLMKREIF